jgi:phospholipid/cholesterol/gamma-HCH transport system permease protein
VRDRGPALALFPPVQQWTLSTRDDRVELAGELHAEDAAAVWRALHAAKPTGEQVTIDLARVTAMDGAIVALLVERRAELVAAGTRCELVDAPPNLAPLVHLYGGDAAVASRAPRPHEPAIARLGAATERGLAGLETGVGFVGELVAAIGTTARRPRSANWRALPQLIERAGTDAIPIVVLLNFLVGFVGAFQSMVQLKQFGANVYVADIVGVSVTRELGPLITGIIVGGRSGAGYAAEIGTMRVSEEVDALRTMGFAPQPYLVLPRIVALAIATPILALLGDVAGVLGGLVVGVSKLGLTATGFITELRTIVVPSDVWTGLVKCAAFGAAIAAIGCQQGLATRNAAQGVGRSATATVVYCLFAIIALDTAFTMLFRSFDL